MMWTHSQLICGGEGRAGFEIITGQGRHKVELVGAGIGSQTRELGMGILKRK